MLSKKRNELTVQKNLSGMFDVEDNIEPFVINRKASLSIEKALEIVVSQMRANGLWERTILYY